MARTKQAKAKLPAPPPAGEAQVWGVELEKWREICAFCLGSLAALLFLALLSDGLQRRWIGEAGEAVATAANFLFGSYGVSYALPALLMLAAIHAFRGHTSVHPLRKVISGVLVLAALCALTALPHVRSSTPQEDGVYEVAHVTGGLLGSIITTDARYALNLPQLCGPLGAYLVCLMALLLGVMLSTDFLFVPLFRRSAATVRHRVAEWRRPDPVATLHFDRGQTPRVFPAGADGGKTGRRGTSPDDAEGPDGGRQLLLLEAEVLEPPFASEIDGENGTRAKSAAGQPGEGDSELPVILSDGSRGKGSGREAEAPSQGSAARYWPVMCSKVFRFVPFRL